MTPSPRPGHVPDGQGKANRELDDRPDWERQLLAEEGVASLDEIDDEINERFEDEELDDIDRIARYRAEVNARWTTAEQAHAANHLGWVLDPDEACLHCHLSPRRTRVASLCNACYVHQRRTGGLPSEDLIRKRLDRQMRRP